MSQLVFQGLNLAPMKEVIFFAAAAIRALKATNKQDRHADGHEDGQHIRICGEPMHYAMHKLRRHITNSKYTFAK